jgi:hypothetical protein
MTDNRPETAGLDFLDFIFTIAMSVGLTPEILQVTHIKGIISEEWIIQGRWPNPDEIFHLLIFSLGFLTLTLSWFGYHASIIFRPLRYDSTYGMIRFIMDVLLVVLYGVILISYKNFGVVLGLHIVVYFLFVVWDLLKIREHKATFKAKPGNNLQRYRREWVTFISFMLFFALGVSYFWFELWPKVGLSLALLITVFYRVNKILPIWERLFGVSTA